MPQSRVPVAKEPLGRRLRRLRKERRLTLGALAEQCGLTRAEIQDVEAGRVADPDLLFGVRLAEVLQVDPEYLAFGSDA